MEAASVLVPEQEPVLVQALAQVLALEQARALWLVQALGLEPEVV